MNALAQPPSGFTRVLIADDDPLSRSLLEIAVCNWGYETVTLAEGKAAWAALRDPDGPCLAILDWSMPGLTGPEICQRIRQQARSPYVYVLILTTHDDKGRRAAALRAGADDYLTKPFDDDELEVRLRTGRRIVELQAELMAARESVCVDAIHDPATGILNRRGILEVLDRELARSRREKAPVAALLAGIDGFRDFDHQHGHPEGDALLREAASRIQEALRASDTLGRYGDDEFLAVLPRCDARSARVVAARLRGAFAEEFRSSTGAALPVTCSVGVAVAESQTDWDSDELLRLTDVYQSGAPEHDGVSLGPHPPRATARASRKGRS